MASPNFNPFLQDNIVQNVLPINLTNAIDPAFTDPQRFAQYAGSQIVYQLVTHFKNQALHLIHTIVTQLPQLDNGLKLATFPEPTATSAAMLQRDDAQQAFEQIMAQVTITYYNIPVQFGNTTPDPTRTYTNTPRLQGTGSYIGVDTKLIMDVHNATNNNQRMLQQWSIFFAAHILFHELAHAIVEAVLPTDYGNRCYLGQAHSTEIGLEFEYRLFGGLVRPYGWPRTIHPAGTDDTIDAIITYRDWPDHETIAWYQTLPAFRQVMTSTILQDMRHRIWTYAFSNINNMFQDVFWNAPPSATGLFPVTPQPGICGQAGIFDVDALGRGQMRTLGPNDPEFNWHMPPYVLQPDSFIRLP